MYNMNQIVNKFLLAGDKFIPEMCLRPFTKTKERIQKLKKKQEIHDILIKTN